MPEVARGDEDPQPIHAGLGVRVSRRLERATRRVSPSRVAAQVTSGIGFIGAGGAFCPGLSSMVEDGRRHVVAVAVGVLFRPDAIAAIVPLAILILTKPMKRRLFLNRKVDS